MSIRAVRLLPDRDAFDRRGEETSQTLPRSDHYAALSVSPISVRQYLACWLMYLAARLRPIDESRAFTH